MDMEICGNLMGQSRENPPTPSSNGNSNVCWSNHIWELNSSSRLELELELELDWVNSTPEEGGGVFQQQQAADPAHLMCLKLGKRHYFEDATIAPSLLMGSGKRGKPSCCGDIIAAGSVVRPYAPPQLSNTVPPRCQVEGCHVPLLNAKDYHRRHRVCEMHSKAPKVVLLGLHQRFCQQCSRFHVVSEFDDSKRSCRRRLAGHNERRRKTNSHESVAAPRNNVVCSQSQLENKWMRGTIIPSATGRALSLLSSKNESWATSSELSSRSSAALRELIEENRAAILARQLILDRGDWWQPNHTDDFGGVGFHEQEQGFYYEQQQQQQQPQQQQHQHGWERIHDENGDAQVTLDLMQAPNNAFGLLSVRGKGKSKEEEDEQQRCHFWNSFQDHHSHVL